MPTISVIIPTYNRRQFIGETLGSVLAQTYQDWEVIVVDDGSTDGTGDLLRERYAREPRVRYLWQENAERAKARNTGITAAKGEFIAFLDSDDLWLPTKLERQMQHFAVAPQSVMVHTAYSQLFEDGTTAPVVLMEAACRQGDIFGSIVYNNCVGSPTPLVRRWVFDRVGGFNEDRQLVCFEDWEMWTRTAALGPVGYISESLALHRLHRQNTEMPLAPRVYCRFVQSILHAVGGPRRAATLASAGQRFWCEIQEAVQRQDIPTARAYFQNGMACLGPRMLLEAVSNRWVAVNLVLGRRAAKTLMAFWLLLHRR